MARLSRFFIIGVFCTAVDYLAYQLFISAQFHLGLAKAVSFAIGTFVGYIGNKNWTFGDTSRNLAVPVRYYLLYLTTMGVNCMANAAMLAALKSIDSIVLAKDIAFITATSSSTIINFCGQRRLVFLAAKQPGDVQRRFEVSALP